MFVYAWCVYLHTSIHVHTYVCMHVCMYACMYISGVAWHVFVCLCVCVRVACVCVSAPRVFWYSCARAPAPDARTRPGAGHLVCDPSTLTPSPTTSYAHTQRVMNKNCVTQYKIFSSTSFTTTITTSSSSSSSSSPSSTSSSFPHLPSLEQLYESGGNAGDSMHVVGDAMLPARRSRFTSPLTPPPSSSPSGLGCGV
jgi:hypothetical protein